MFETIESKNKDIRTLKTEVKNLTQNVEKLSNENSDLKNYYENLLNDKEKEIKKWKHGCQLQLREITAIKRKVSHYLMFFFIFIFILQLKKKI